LRDDEDDEVFGGEWPGLGVFRVSKFKINSDEREIAGI
jgi:hypothetical protein